MAHRTDRMPVTEFMPLSPAGYRRRPMLARMICRCLPWLAMTLACSQVLGQAPEAVTTDTAAYCDQLQSELIAEEQARAHAPPEVKSLGDEGQRLCGQGQIRGGIYRLRRALMMMHHGDPTE